MDGKVRQTVVAHLGAFPCYPRKVGLLEPHGRDLYRNMWLETREQADAYARTKGIMCGAAGCGREGTEEMLGQTAFTSNPHHRDPKPYLLCETHAAALHAGETIQAYHLRREE